MKRYHLTCPAVGTGEIGALVGLLSDQTALPEFGFQHSERCVVHLLAQDFATFIAQPDGPLPPFIGNIAARPGREGLLFAVGMASATGALTALLESAEVRGGEVITTSFNYPGVINAIIHAGATPRCVDIDPDSWCMDTVALAGALGRKTRAIILTHVNRCVDLEPVADLYARKGLEMPLLQDASLAPGSTSRGIRAGFLNLGDGGATVYSLAPSKILSGLGGGIVLTSNRSLADRLLVYASQGMSRCGGSQLEMPGTNLKMGEMNAAIARSMLSRRNEIFGRRRELRAIFDRELAPLVSGGAVALQDAGDDAVITHYGVLLPDRDRLALRLHERWGVALGLWYVHHAQAIYRDLPWARRARLPVSESIADRVAFLPFHTGLTDDDARAICHAVAEEVANL